MFNTEEDVVKKENGKKKIDWSAFIKKYLIIGILIAMIVFISILRPNFLSFTNIMNLLVQSSIYGIIAFGALIAITSGGIDLSLGSVIAFSGILAGVFSQTQDAIDKIFPGLGSAPLIVTILIALGSAALIGYINGILIADFDLPPFIATLGTQITFRGAALMMSGGRPVSNINPQINIFGTRLFGWLPVPVIVYVAVIVFMFVLMKYTTFGKSIYAIGGNQDAAEVSGIKVKKNIRLIYALSATLAGIAAIIYIGRTGGSIQPAAAVGYETQAIAATTIGGTSHNGGIGTVWGTVIGALILGVLTNGFTLLGVDAYIQQIVLGLIIIGAVIIDMRKNR